MLPVKVCCIQDEAEAQLAMSCGAQALGLVSKMPSGWGPIADARIAEIVRTIPPFITSVLLTSLTTPQAVIEQQRRVGANALQLVDAFPLDGYAALRQALPGVQLLKAVHVYGPESIDEALELAQHVDGLILDTGSPKDAAVKVLGGSGRTHDWSISRQIVQRAACPVLLAGGLKPHNVAEAIRTVQPYGLDLCTGVRTGAESNFALDESKLRAFFASARQG